MINLLRTRWKQGYRTIAYPDQLPVLPDRFRGRPVIDAGKCVKECHACADACPTGAIIRMDSAEPQIDLGRCLFCTDCVEACPNDAIHHDADFRLSANQRTELIVPAESGILPQVAKLEEECLRIFGRSLKLRQVSAGGCNGCEADVNVLSTIVYDLGRFGIQFVASPRHADGLLITGPVTANMKTALLKTWEAVPAPKIVIAVGACAIAGGPFMDHPEVNNGAGDIVPIDLYVPGCPPHPMTILDGMLRLLGRIQPSSPRDLISEKFISTSGTSEIE
jgi:Ni,Fe-hydrogenase III small subunit/formate hydrogenlyase subunit 6/NADH:ubiquinone oxidoreductase subunit I